MSANSLFRRHHEVHAQRGGRAGAGKKTAPALGEMPEWNLSDLYPSPRSKSLDRDIAKAARESAAFKARYQGKLSADTSVDIFSVGLRTRFGGPAPEPAPMK